MKLLLDTQAFLWFLTDDPKLSGKAKVLIETPANVRLFSVASLWEIAIKVSIGKLTLAKPYEHFLAEQLRLNDIILLDIRLEHTALVAKLPLHHRDPFDRLIAAQSLVENLPVISSDQGFDAYGVQRQW